MSCYGQVLGILSFGDCGGSSESLLETSILNQAVSSSIQESQTNVGNVTITAQNQNVQIIGAGSLCCSDLDVNQKTDIIVKYTADIINNLHTKISQAFQNNIDSSLEASQANKKGLLAGADTSKLKTTIKNAVKTYFENTQNQNSITNVLNKFIGTQVQNVQIICPEFTAEDMKEGIQAFPGLPKTGCKINQEFYLNLAAATCVKNVLESDTLQDALADISSELKTTQANKGEGLSDLWGIFIIIGIVIIVGIVAFVIWTNTKGGQQVLSQGGNFMGSFKGISPPTSNIRTLTDYIPRF